jgi:hypothetical protein
VHGFFYFLYVVSVALLAAALAVCAGVAGMAMLWSRLRGRTAGSAVRSVAFVAVSGLVGFAVTSVVSNVIAGDLPVGSYTRRFDPGSWRRATRSPSEADSRLSMLGDVVRRVLPGRSRAEIEELLGPAEIAPGAPNGSPSLTYALGRLVPLFGVEEGEWLFIWLDESGVFARFEVRTYDGEHEVWRPPD